MTFDNKSALKSDVVLIDGRKMTENKLLIEHVIRSGYLQRVMFLNIAAIEDQ